MMHLFSTTPKCRQLIWGDASKQDEWLHTADVLTPVQCLDVCGCRSNVIMERTRPLPIGCPLDDVEAVFEDGHYRRPLTDFEWVWVDLYEQQDADAGFQDVPELHRCYDGPHMYCWKRYST